jgi:hypothetical protein
MNATTVEIDSGHLSLITHPHEVTKLILSAPRRPASRAQHAAAEDTRDQCVSWCSARPPGSAIG